MCWAFSWLATYISWANLTKGLPGQISIKYTSFSLHPYHLGAISFPGAEITVFYGLKALEGEALGKRGIAEVANPAYPPAFFFFPSSSSHRLKSASTLARPPSAFFWC